MTLKKLSEITGYSISTLSKVFSDSKEISKDTKKEVIKLAKELGVYEKYCKTPHKNKVIAVLTPELSSAFYNEIVTKIKGYCQKQNATVSVSVYNFSVKEEQDLITFYTTQNKVDGIIIITGNTRAKKYSSVPMVYFDGTAKNDYADTVKVDFSIGILETVQELKNNGHERIAFIGEVLTPTKQELFKQAMNKVGLPSCDVIIRKERFEQAGYLGAQELYEKGNLPTAIFCAYDYIALGVIDFLSTVGLKVPEDVSVVGMDDIKLASYKNISLSSVAIGLEQTCKLLTDLVFDRISSPYKTLVKHVTVNSRFIQRGSVKKIN